MNPAPQEPPAQEHASQDFVPEYAPETMRLGIRVRWLLDCLLPVIIIVVAVGMFAVYCRYTMTEGIAMATVFSVAVGVAIVMSVWLVSDRFINDIMRSVGQLQNQARRIKEVSYGIRTRKLRNDEMGDLTEDINEMSAEIARSKTLQSEFVSSVSHELRTPLTAITGWAEELTLDPAIQGNSRTGLEIISKEAGRLTKMVGELLEFTRIQDGRFNLNIETVDLPAVVEDSAFTYRNLMEQEGLTLKYDCDEETIPLIEGDPERLKQVFLNILDNAAKYGKDGGSVEVSVRAQGNWVMVCTRDHGPGIPEDELPHVKERFYKGSSRERGSGIGLAICEEIVTRHAGELLIRNAEGGGVMVLIRLPVKQSFEPAKQSFEKENNK